MKVMLQIGERINLLGLLPSEANLVTLRVVQEMKRKLGISAEEIQKVELKVDDEKEQVRWNSDKDLPVEMEFNAVEVEIIEKELRKLDKSAKLTERHLSLCEKFKMD